MRQPTNLLRALVILLVMGFAARAHADDRTEARAHYQAAVKHYSGGDYRSAIREFSAAQQLVPADLNNYNLALCYDKLGDAEPAIQYYRAFLDKQPGSDKRSEIEASISRLEAAARSAASKRSDETRKADEARKAEAARAAEAQRPAGPVLGPAPPPSSGTGPGDGPGVGPGGPAPAIGPSAGPVLGPAPAPSAPVEERRPPKPKHGPAIAGSTGAPSSAAPPSTGDQQLDRVGSMNIDDIRDQRMGGGAADGRGGPAVAAGSGPSQPGQPGQPALPEPGAMNGPPIGGPDEPKKEAPVYKKWWFWVVVAVGTVVAYEVAFGSSSQSGDTKTFSRASPQPGGLTLLHW